MIWNLISTSLSPRRPNRRTARTVTPIDFRPGPWLQLFEPHGWEWNRYELPIPHLPGGLDGLRIVHLSDFHAGPRWIPAYDLLHERLVAARPDLILVTGDFCENKRDHKPAMRYVRRLVKGFVAKHGCFGIIGNHDQHPVAPKLAGTNVTVIENAHKVLEINGSKLELIGLPGHHRSELDERFLNQLPRRDRETPRIILSHFPDHIRKIAHLNADVVLTGHTHGGQVCLPGGRAIIRHDTLPPSMVKGIHRWENTWLVVNKGFGFSGPPIRLFCPAEVLELTLRRA